MRNMKSSLIALLAAFVGITMFTPTTSASQTKSNVAPVTVNFTVPEVLSISVAGGPLTIPSGNGVSNLATITGNYLLANTHTQGILLAVYPAGGTTAALSGPANIPSANVGVLLGASTWGTCNQADPDGISGAADNCIGATSYGTLLTQSQVATAGYSGTLPSSTIGFNFVNGDVPTLAGTYSGIFNVVAFAP